MDSSGGPSLSSPAISMSIRARFYGGRLSRAVLHYQSMMTDGSGEPSAKGQPPQERAMWNLPPPPGFQGLHPDKPLTVYQRHLPHWRQDGATYFVTFRLADSLPQSKLAELVCLREAWERRHAPPRAHAAWEELTRQVYERVERWLDQGMGSCVLQDTSLAAWVTSALHHFDDDRYELDCYAVMPNHVCWCGRCCPQRTPWKPLWGAGRSTVRGGSTVP
jgi:hypothetical protein